MNQKEYELLAGMVRFTTPEPITDDNPDGYNAGWKDGAARQHALMRDSLVAALQTNYPNFDKEKFLTACKVVK